MQAADAIPDTRTITTGSARSSDAANTGADTCAAGSKSPHTGSGSS